MKRMRLKTYPQIEARPNYKISLETYQMHFIQILRKENQN